jgi:hypothetical protein
MTDFEAVTASAEFQLYCQNNAGPPAVYTIRQIEKTVTPFGLNIFEIARDAEIAAIYESDVYGDGEIKDIAGKGGISINVPSKSATQFMIFESRHFTLTEQGAKVLDFLLQN